MWFQMSDCILFVAHIFNIHRSGVLITLICCCTTGAMWNCCRLSASSVYNIQPYTSLQCYFIQSHIGMAYVCLAVTCQLYFWWNDWDPLHAAAVTWGWNGYWNKSQHRKLTLEKKIIPPFLPGLEPWTFQSQVQCSNQWTIPDPQNQKYTCDMINCFQILLFKLTFFITSWRTHLR